MSLKDTFQHSIRIAGNKASVLLYPAVAVALVLRVLLDPAKGGAYLLDAFVDKIAPDLLAGGLGDMVNKIKEKGHFNEADLIRMQGAVENVFSTHSTDLESLLSNQEEYEAMITEVLSREDLIIQILDSHTDEIIEVLDIVNSKLDLLVPIYEATVRLETELGRLGGQIEGLRKTTEDREENDSPEDGDYFNDDEDDFSNAEKDRSEYPRLNTLEKLIDEKTWLKAEALWLAATESLDGDSSGESKQARYVIAGKLSAGSLELNPYRIDRWIELIELNCLTQADDEYGYKDEDEKEKWNSILARCEHALSRYSELVESDGTTRHEYLAKLVLLRGNCKLELGMLDSAEEDFLVVINISRPELTSEEVERVIELTAAMSILDYGFEKKVEKRGWSKAFMAEYKAEVRILREEYSKLLGKYDRRKMLDSSIRKVLKIREDRREPNIALQREKKKQEKERLLLYLDKKNSELNSSRRKKWWPF